MDELPQVIIKAKRDKCVLSPSQSKTFLNSYLEGSVTDYQMSALLMAVYFSGLSAEELSTWTEVMVESGTRLNIPHDHVVDKHSTGGVGDKTSLIVAPIVASLGCVVPMISGRGLGHTGGTLDKLESVPGLKIPQTNSEILKLVEKHGLAYAGQTETTCPLDRKLYALRDVTGTVESPDLIAASIMSKKISEGLRGLTLDVKCGSGAFMKTRDEAEGLVDRMQAIAASHTLTLRGIISNMNQPLGKRVGLRPEIHEVLEIYRGNGPEDVREVCVKLASLMLVCSGKEKEEKRARSLVEQSLKDGSAYQKFCDVIAAQGGDISTFERENFYINSPITQDVTSLHTGYISAMDCEKMGYLIAGCGAGRHRVSDAVNPHVGLLLHKKLGDKVSKGEKLLTLYVSADVASDVISGFQSCFVYQSQPIKQQPLIIEEF